MKAWFEDRGVVLPAVPPAFPALKPAATAQDERILGDGSGNGAVTWWDLWYFWHHLTGGYDDFSLDLDLLDIDRNGKTDWVDLGLLGDYLFGTGSNPHGIGQPLSSSITASLSPDPTGFDFKDDGIWHRFTVNVDPPGSTVQVVVNATSEATLGLEIAQGARAPATSFCPGERDDTRQNFGDGATVWIAGCAEGATNILIADTDHEVLASYEIHVSRDVDASFDIEIVFIGNDITTTHQSFIRRAADRWEAIITEDIPDIADVGFDSNDHAASWWSQWDRVGIGPLRVQESIDDVRIYVGQMKAGLNVLCVRRKLLDSDLQQLAHPQRRGLPQRRFHRPRAPHRGHRHARDRPRPGLWQQVGGSRPTGKPIRGLTRTPIPTSAAGTPSAPSTAPAAGATRG